MSPLTKSLISASAGALAYGSWAFYVNSSAGMGMGITTAIVQGSFSFVLTMTLTLLIEFLFQRLGGQVSGALITIAIASLFMFTTAYTLQWLAQAPHILTTILPGWVIGSIYAGVYTLSLHKQAQQPTS